MAIQARTSGYADILVPAENAAEASEKIQSVIAEIQEETRSTAEATRQGASSVQAGEAANLPMVHEVFADRAYERDGTLRPRSKPGALITDPSVVPTTTRQKLDLLVKKYLKAVELALKEWGDVFRQLPRILEREPRLDADHLVAGAEVAGGLPHVRPLDRPLHLEWAHRIGLETLGIELEKTRAYGDTALSFYFR